MSAVVAVEEVTGGKALARFVELPHALHGNDPRFAPLVLAWERYRLDPRRNPFFERGDGRYFLARRAGRPVGRITAHVAEPGAEGCFGFWWLDDDAEVARALLDAAREWMASERCTSMTGPLSFTRDEEAGVRVAGFDHSGTTGRPWHPRHLHRLLEANGAAHVEDLPMWELPATQDGPVLPPDDDLPGQAGAYADPRICLAGIAAVPDVSPALRGAGFRGAWRAAKRAKAGDWDTCTVVRCTLDPTVAVPALQQAAGQAGYERILAPWSPNAAAPPRTVHRVYRFTW